jgi:acetyltransferase-like isoleucine patch superfamily enzyme
MFSSKLRRITSLPLYDQCNLASLYWYFAKGYWFYRPFFGSFGWKSAIYPPTLIGSPRFIHIGERVLIRNGARIEAILLDPGNPPEIRIDDDVNIEQDVHIVATGRVHIHSKVSIAPRSTVLGARHPFTDLRNPVKIGNRLGGAGSLTEVGEGSLLGVGSVVHMNVKIGRHAVVGSSAVVRKDVPDYCAVDGNPAAVILRYDREEDRWLPPGETRPA